MNYLTNVVELVYDLLEIALELTGHVLGRLHNEHQQEGRGQTVKESS